MPHLTSPGFCRFCGSCACPGLPVWGWTYLGQRSWLRLAAENLWKIALLYSRELEGGCGTGACHLPSHEARVELFLSRESDVSCEVIDDVADQPDCPIIPLAVHTVVRPLAQHLTGSSPPHKVENFSCNMRTVATESLLLNLCF